MVWVAVIFLSLILLFSFPKQFLSVLAIIGISITAIIFGLMNAEKNRAQERKEQRDSVYISALFDQERCSAEYPIVISIRNTNEETLLSLNFDLSGFREGYSSPVFKTLGQYKSDKILRTGEQHDSCWPVPPLSYSAQAAPPQILNWQATYGYASFQSQR